MQVLVPVLLVLLQLFGAAAAENKLPPFKDGGFVLYEKVLKDYYQPTESRVFGAGAATVGSGNVMKVTQTRGLDHQVVLRISLVPRGGNVVSVDQLSGDQSNEAEEAFLAAIRIEDQAANAFKNLGHLYLTSSRAEQAVPVLSRAAALDPQDPAPLTFLGEALYQTGDFTGAVDPLRRALELDPSAYQASYRLGFTCLRLERYPEALDAFEQFLDTNQSFDTSQVERLVEQLRERLR